MERYLSREAYRAVVTAIDEGTPITRPIADQVATGMQAWAMERGVTHFTHWFHPLTDATAEKHDSFVGRGERGLSSKFFQVRCLCSRSLMPQASPAEAYETLLRRAVTPHGMFHHLPSSLTTTLCIPTVFISYTGEALDYKTPLLRSLSALDRAAVEGMPFVRQGCKEGYRHTRMGTGIFPQLTRLFIMPVLTSCLQTVR